MSIAGKLGDNNAKYNDIGGIAANDKWALSVYITPTHSLMVPGKGYTHKKLHLIRINKEGKAGKPKMLYPDVKENGKRTSVDSVWKRISSKIL